MQYPSNFPKVRNFWKPFVIVAAVLLMAFLISCGDTTPTPSITPSVSVGGNNCDVIILNPGQCICHNFLHKADETCPSAQGVVSGHDCHLAEYCCYYSLLPDPPPEFCNFTNSLDCSLISEGGVIDKWGKCNGCGDGTTESAEGCCDPDDDPFCTDPSQFCEECDDGDNVNGTHNCDENCQLENCGNDVIEEFEQCDGTALGDCDACNTDCQCCPDMNDDGQCDTCEVDEDCAYDRLDACIESVSCINGECVIQPVDCNDGNFCTDDSCDSTTGCVNTPNDKTTPCYTGPEGTEGVGVCQGGERICIDGLLTEACLGEIIPSAEICDDGLDNDCDGQADEEEDCPPGAPPETPDTPEAPKEIPVSASLGGCSLVL